MDKLRRENLELSIRAFGDASWREAQVARSSWKLGRLLKAMGNEIESEALLAKAMSIRHKLVPDDKRAEDSLVDKDW